MESGSRFETNMLVGAVRACQGALGRAVRALVLMTGVAFPAEAQEAPMPPLSPSCRAPIVDIATLAPLPHLTGALKSRRTIRVLAIGSSSTVGVGASSPARNYPAQLEA